MKKEVFIIFKTHLDIGFTDYSKNVVDKYLNAYIPNAIKIGYELKGTDTPFIWTVGSWLLWEGIKHDKDGTLSKAIEDGVITWHALPFTSHTELMNKELFEYGLSLSEKLDKRFGKHTIGGKMTDVPGHTIAMLPLLHKRNIKFLHIGVNPATPVPEVPDVFIWKDGDAEVLVMYDGSYGETKEFDDFVVYFAHTGDNLGPQSAEDIIGCYEELSKKYPDYELKAATLNDLADKISTLSDLPVIEKEIGDAWIHGAGTDPQKLSRYRKLLRHIENNPIDDLDLSDNLLVVPEHTWGMNVQIHFHNDKDYTYREMEKLAEERRVIEKSWEEQRDYVKKAEKLLGVTPDYPVLKPELSKYTEIETPNKLDFEISWQLFDRSDYKRYEEDYLRMSTDEEWVKWDNTKVGLPDYKGGVYTAEIKKAYALGDERLYHLEFDKSLADRHGLPQLYLKVTKDNVELKWFGKKMSRLPQAFWFKFLKFEEKWQINKMDKWINPEDIIGSPLICATDKGVKNKDVHIYPLDCALVAPFGRRLLQYNCKNLNQDMYFNLYNNIWNTNFPMWYSDDAVFRFDLKK